MEPKFKPGDFVMFCAAIESVKLTGDQVKPFVVTESHVITCPGGTQVYYKLGIAGDRLANEIELEPWDSVRAFDAYTFGKDRKAFIWWSAANAVENRKAERQD